MATPVRILIASLLAFGIVVYLFKTAAVPRYMILMIAVAFWAILRWLSLRTAKATRQRRAQELEELKKKPILHLED